MMGGVETRAAMNIPVVTDTARILDLCRPSLRYTRNGLGDTHSSCEIGDSLSNLLELGWFCCGV